MTVALQAPHSLGALISVDNAPVDARLQGNFHRYVQGLQEIETAQVMKQAEADKILARYEKVGCHYE